MCTNKAARVFIPSVTSILSTRMKLNDHFTIDSEMFKVEVKISHRIIGTY